MAERTIILNAEVNTGNSAKDLKELDQGIKGATKSAKDLDATFEEVYGDMKPLSARLGELEDRMYEMALAGQENTKEFRDLQKEAVRFRKTIIQTDAAVDAFADTGSNVNAALQLSEGVVGGYEGFLGVTALMGVESEALMETLTKLQAVQSVGNSIQAISNTLSKESAFLLKAKAVQQTLLTGATGAYNAVVGTSTGLLKAFRLALIATGIGAIIVAIGFLVANWDEFTGVVRKSVTALKDFADTVTGFLIPGYNELLEAQRKANAEAEKEAAAREKVIAAERNKIKELTALAEQERKLTEEKVAGIDFEIRKRTALGQDTFDLEMQKLKVIAESARREIEIRQQQAAAFIEIEKQKGSFVAGFIESLGIEEEALLQNLGTFDEQTKTLQANLEKTLQDIEVLQLQHNKKMSDAAAERKRIEEDLQEFLRKLRDENLNLSGRSIELELQQAREAAKQRIKLIEESDLSEIEKEQAKNLIMQNLKLQNEQILSELDVQAKDASIEREEKYEKTVTGIVKKNQEERQRIRDLDAEQRKMILDATLDTAQATFTGISDLAEAFAGDSERRQKQAFRVQKAASIANATIETYKAAQSAYASLSGIPVVGPGLGVAAAAAAIASGIARVKKIASQKFEGGGSGNISSGGGGGTSQGITSGSINQQQQQAIQLFGQANEGGTLMLGNDGIGGSTQQGQQTIEVKAQVVADDISAVQSNTATVQDRFSG